MGALSDSQISPEYAIVTAQCNAKSLTCAIEFRNSHRQGQYVPANPSLTNQLQEKANGRAKTEGHDWQLTGAERNG